MATRAILILGLLLFISACQAPQPMVRTDQYHDSATPAQATKPLNGLQLKAIELMNQQHYEQAILYLQRAINIEPRNPLNWHYLAQNYWHLQDYENCRAMIQRSMAYSQFDKDLTRANSILRRQCSP